MDNYISRQAAIDGKISVQRANGVEIYSDDAVPVTYLENLPSADVQPLRHGHWINHPDDLFPEDSMIECSVCHEYEYATANDNFCGNCGAKMDEVT